MYTFILISCSLFIIACIVSIYINFRNNPYIGYQYFIDADKGENSELFISESTMVDGKGNPIPKFKRVSCIVGQKYTKRVSDWFYNIYQSNEPLMNLVQIDQNKATAIYKRHRRYTLQVKNN